MVRKSVGHCPCRFESGRPHQLHHIIDWTGVRILSLTLIIAGLVIVAVIFGAYPQLDLRGAALFYDTATHSFALAENPVIVGLRNLNSAVDIVIGIVLVASIVIMRIYPNRAPPVSLRTIVFLVATFLVVPVLIANGVFKEHWSRPRPSHVTEFGGPAHFVAWWDPRGTCQRGCSFFSGEVAAAAWTAAPAILAPASVAPLAIAGAMVFTVAIAIVRMAQGGHFLSDAAFGALLTWLSIWLAYNLGYRHRSKKHSAN
jgi:membrane-associated PAP2 superfamily phosphatase